MRWSSGPGVRTGLLGTLFRWIWSSPPPGPPVEKQGVEPGLSSSSHTWGIRAACSIPGARPCRVVKAGPNPLPDGGCTLGLCRGRQVLRPAGTWLVVLGSLKPPPLSAQALPLGKRPFLCTFLCFRLPAPRSPWMGGAAGF